jgi:hypothetical protein
VLAICEKKFLQVGNDPIQMLLKPSFEIVRPLQRRLKLGLSSPILEKTLMCLDKSGNRFLFFPFFDVALGKLSNWGRLRLQGVPVEVAPFAWAKVFKNLQRMGSTNPVRCSGSVLHCMVTNAIS